MRILRNESSHAFVLSIQCYTSHYTEVHPQNHRHHVLFFFLLLKQALGNMPLSLHSFLKLLLSKPASAFKNKPSTLICASRKVSKMPLIDFSIFVKIMMFARYGFRYSQRNASSVSQIQCIGCVRLLTPLISNRFSAFCSTRVTAVQIYT